MEQKKVENHCSLHDGVKVNEGLERIVKSLHEGCVIDRCLRSRELAGEAPISVGQNVLLFVVLPRVVDLGHVDVVLEGNFS